MGRLIEYSDTTASYTAKFIFYLVIRVRRLKTSKDLPGQPFIKTSSHPYRSRRGWRLGPVIWILMNQPPGTADGVKDYWHRLPHVPAASHTPNPLPNSCSVFLVLFGSCALCFLPSLFPILFVLYPLCFLSSLFLIFVSYLLCTLHLCFLYTLFPNIFASLFHVVFFADLLFFFLFGSYNHCFWTHLFLVFLLPHPLYCKDLRVNCVSY